MTAVRCCCRCFCRPLCADKRAAATPWQLRKLRIRAAPAVPLQHPQQQTQAQTKPGCAARVADASSTIGTKCSGASDHDARRHDLSPACPPCGSSHRSARRLISGDCFAAGCAARQAPHRHRCPVPVSPKGSSSSPRPPQQPQVSPMAAFERLLPSHTLTPFAAPPQMPDARALMNCDLSLRPPQQPQVGQAAVVGRVAAVHRKAAAIRKGRRLHRWQEPLHDMGQEAPTEGFPECCRCAPQVRCHLARLLPAFMGGVAT